MDLYIRYRVTGPDGTALDEFVTNSPWFAEERINRLRQTHPDLTVAETVDE